MNFKNQLFAQHTKLSAHLDKNILKYTYTIQITANFVNVLFVK